MKNQKIVASLILLGLLALPVLAFAQPTNTIESIDQLYDVVARAIWVIFGIIALVMFVIAGILFLTAAGQPERIVQARQAFLWGVAGVVVGILAFSIVTIMENLF